jgi:hypothetical protein
MHQRVVFFEKLLFGSFYYFRPEKMGEAVLGQDEQLDLTVMAIMVIIITWLGA